MTISLYTASIAAALQTVRAEVEQDRILAALAEMMSVESQRVTAELDEKMAGLTANQQEHIRFWLKNLRHCANNLGEIGDELTSAGGCSATKDAGPAIPSAAE